MGWVKVSDDFYDNDKMLAAGSIGRDLYWHGMAFCNRNLTDGLIPRARALILVDFTDAAVLTGAHSGVDGVECAPIAVERVLAANLWHEDDHDCPDCVQPGPRHYVVHDYLKYQPSRAEVEAKAEATRERVRRFKERQKSGNAVTNALVTQVVTPPVTHTKRPTPTPNPNPTPRTTSMVLKGGAVTKRNARESPRPRCRKHPDENSLDSCHACAKRRQWDEDQLAADAADELDAKRQERALSENCPDCHGTNVVEIADDAVRKCQHPNSASAHA